jgi:hypothetical protein
VPVGVVNRLSDAIARRTSRRGFLARTAVTSTAAVVAPQFLVRPISAYAAVCNCSGSACDCGAACCDGYTEFCCTVTGANTCPPGTAYGGWWKVDGHSLCGGGPRYYLDCNVVPPANPCSCGCAGGDCNHRKVCCTLFRYGQCHQEIPVMGAIACRVVTCTPPWQFDSTCTTTPLTDNNTRLHDAACLHPAPSGGMENDMPTVAVRRVVINPDDPTKGYILDARGGIHPFGGAKRTDSIAYWAEGAAIDLVIADWSIPSGYILDCKGALHGFGGLTKPPDGPYWPGAFVPPTPPG